MNTTGMTLIVAKPPFYDRIVKVLGGPPPGTVFCYGDVVYSPDSATLSNDVWVHEAVHAEQQAECDEVGDGTPNDPPKSGKDWWWDQYLADPDWRLTWELEAYRVQYMYMRENVKDRTALARWLLHTANILASPMYGSLVTSMEAYRAIKA